MMGVGISEMLLVLMMSGGMGFPLGIPPQAEDPTLAKMAPAKVLFYGSWAGVKKPEAGSSNSTEALLAEPEVQKAIQQVVGIAHSMTKLGGREVNDDRARAMLNKLPDLALAVLTNAGAMYIEEFDIPQKKMVGGIALNWGGDAEQLIKQIEFFQRQFVPPNQLKTVTISGKSFHQFDAGNGAPKVTWGRWNNYLLLGVGDSAISDMIKRSTGTAPEWLTNISTRLPIKRRATVSYVNLKAIMDIAGGLLAAENPAVIQYLKMAGVDKLQSLVNVTGLDEQGMANRTFIQMSGYSGVFELFHGESIKSKHLKRVPGDAVVAFNVGVNLGKMYDAATKLAGQLAPNELEMFEAQLGQVEEMLDVSIRRDLLGNLDGIWQLYTSQSSGGLFTGWTASVGIKDAAKIRQLHEKMMVMSRVELRNEGAEIKKTQFGKHTIHYMSFAEAIPFAPAWCLTDDQLVFGMFPQTLKAHLSRPDGESLADSAAVKNILNGNGQVYSLFYQDTREFFRLVYPFLQIILQSASGEARSEGIPFDAADILPSQYVIDKHLKPGVAVVRAANDGIEFHATQTIPSGSPLALAPVMVGLTLPAVQQAREAARRVASSNNLKQIGIAMHNFHDVHKALPAGYSADKKGKRLLSWRVHLLPYVDQQGLYEQFNLDEPWDSDNNKRLIEQMPPVFRSPKSVAPAGHTTYRGNAQKQGVFIKPRMAAKGARFRDIVDGLTQTLAVVDAGDNNSVILTKPDPLVLDDEKPLDDFSAGARQDFLALFCDGHVTLLSRNLLTNKIFRAMLTRNGGEPQAQR